ncbi:MAG: NapC/NirT family cytochrome c [Coriobacteriia bacterium]|nr:NapC/NirT family cytochrome c [Coriobacteriia bacterium]
MGEAREPGAGRPATWGRGLLIWLGVGVLLIALVGGGFYVTEQPRFCSGRVCHEMGPSYDAWARSPHPEVGCTECHAAPGPVGFLKAHVVDGLRDVWVHVTERPDRITEASPVPGSRCLHRCHREQFEAFERGARRAVENPLPARHPDRGSDCAECHYDEIHDRG